MTIPTHLSPQRGQSEADRLQLSKRISVVLLLLGALSSFLGVATLEMTPLASGAQLALAIVLTLLGTAIAVVPPNRVLMLAGVIASVCTISGMLATADDFGTTPFFYLWPAVFAAYFVTPRFLLATLATIAVTLMAALVVSSIGWAVKADIFIGTSLSVGGMAALVAYMRNRAERLHDQLELAAHTDALTGLRNRRALDPELERLLAEASSAGTPMSVVMFDLDHFKRFNDHHGHIVGDEALRRMAAVLVDQSRPVDVVARFGGEEFVVVLPGVEVTGACSFAERVAWALGIEPVERSLRLTSSSGVASLDAEAHTETIVALLTRADQALYAAKDAGRARAAWCTADGIEIGDEVQVPAAATLTAIPVPGAPRSEPILARPHVGEHLRSERRSA